MLEEVAVFLRVFGLIGFRINELVIDIDGQIVIVFHLKLANVEEWGHHSRVESSSTGDTLSRIEGTRQLSLVEDLLQDVLDDGCTSAVTDEFNKFDFVSRKAYFEIKDTPKS